MIAASSLALVLALLGQEVKDDSLWINSGIKQAVEAGKDSYEIPAGTYTLRNRILIPSGTRNFALLGAGSDKTFLKVARELEEVIQIGFQVNVNNNSGLRLLDNVVMKAVEDRSKELETLPAQARIEPGYYVLWDQNTSSHQTARKVVYNHAEIVSVAAAEKEQVTLAEPTGRSYEYTPRLANINRALCQEIRLSGFNIDGTCPDGKLAKRAVSAAIVDKLRIRDIRAKNFAECGVQLTLIRNCKVWETDLSNIGEPAHLSYGVRVTKSRFIHIEDVVADRCGQGFFADCGSMDVFFYKCKGNNSQFALAGQDERRVWLDRCSGDLGMIVGSNLWSGSCQETEIKNCYFAGGPLLLNHHTDTLVTDSKFGSISFQGFEQAPVRSVLIKRCSFIADENVINGNTPLHIEDALFQDCKFATSGSKKAQILGTETISGTLNFSNCLFFCASPEPLFSIKGAKGLTFKMKDCELQSRNSRVAITFNSPFEGEYELVNNTFITPRARKLFLLNISEAIGQENGTRLKS